MWDGITLAVLGVVCSSPLLFVLYIIWNDQVRECGLGSAIVKSALSVLMAIGVIAIVVAALRMVATSVIEG